MIYSAIGFCNEKIKLICASQLTKVENPRPQDEDETLQLLKSSGVSTSVIANGDTAMPRPSWLFNIGKMQEIKDRGGNLWKTFN